MNHKSQLHREKVKQELLLDDARRLRLEQSCDEILNDVVVLKSMLHTAGRGHINTTDVQPPLERILRHAVLIPDNEARQRINTLVDIIWYAPAIQHIDCDGDTEISFRAIDSIVETVGSVLRSEHVPAKPTWYTMRKALVDDTIHRFRQGDS